MNINDFCVGDIVTGTDLSEDAYGVTNHYATVKVLKIGEYYDFEDEQDDQWYACENASCNSEPRTCKFFGVYMNVEVLTAYYNNEIGNEYVVAACPKLFQIVSSQRTRISDLSKMINKIYLNELREIGKRNGKEKHKKINSITR